MQSYFKFPNQQTAVQKMGMLLKIRPSGRVSNQKLPVQINLLPIGPYFTTLRHVGDHIPMHG